MVGLVSLFKWPGFENDSKSNCKGFFSQWQCHCNMPTFHRDDYREANNTISLLCLQKTPAMRLYSSWYWWGWETLPSFLLLCDSCHIKPSTYPDPVQNNLNQILISLGNLYLSLPWALCLLGHILPPNLFYKREVVLWESSRLLRKGACVHF